MSELIRVYCLVLPDGNTYWMEESKATDEHVRAVMDTWRETLSEEKKNSMITSGMVMIYMFREDYEKIPATNLVDWSKVGVSDGESDEVRCVFLRGGEIIAVLLAPREKIKKGDYLSAGIEGYVSFSIKETDLTALHDFDNTKSKDPARITVGYCLDRETPICKEVLSATVYGNAYKINLKKNNDD